MSSDPRVRLGVTMRVVAAERYQEVRDALAHDWHTFLGAQMPECAWLPIPNVGRRVVDLVRAWNLTGLILTGGNDVGTAPARDDTESALIAHALDEDMPLFGVCRGLQLLQRYFGGGLERCPAADHVSAMHQVKVVDRSLVNDAALTVNSFHEWSFRAENLAEPLRAFAVASDDWVEGAVAPAHRIMGVMWHPERGRPSHAETVTLMRRFFDLPATARDGHR